MAESSGAPAQILQDLVEPLLNSRWENAEHDTGPSDYVAFPSFAGTKITFTYDESETKCDVAVEIRGVDRPEEKFRRMFVRPDTRIGWKENPEETAPFKGKRAAVFTIRESDGNIFRHFLDKKRSSARVRLLTTVAAFDAFENIILGNTDILPAPAPALTDRTPWAGIHLRYFHNLQKEKDCDVERTHMSRSLKVLLAADGKNYSKGKYEERYENGILRFHKCENEIEGIRGDKVEHILFRDCINYKTYLVEAEIVDSTWELKPDAPWYMLMDRAVTLTTHVRAHLKRERPTEDEQEWNWQSFSQTQNANSEVGLFLRTDGQNSITDKRVIVKPAGSKPSQRRNDIHGFSVEPREVFLYKRIMQLADPSALMNLKHYTYHHSSEAPHYIYLDYAPYGSLAHLVGRYEEFRLEEEMLGDVSEEPKRIIPELFLWIVFRSLVDACWTLQLDPNLKSNEEGTAKKDGEAYIHTDIKLDNIFLFDSPSTTSTTSFPVYPIYKLPILGDYDMYYRLWHEQITDEVNGTDGFKAPEQYEGRYPASARGTDVFQIGIIMTCLMHRYPYGLELNNDSVERDGEWRLEFEALGETHADRVETDKVAEHYSEGLRALVKQCLTFDQLIRVKINVLKKKVRDGLNQFESGLGLAGMSRQEAEDADMSAHLIDLQDDAFAIGKQVIVDAEAQRSAYQSGARKWYGTATKRRIVEWETTEQAQREQQEVEQEVEEGTGTNTSQVGTDTSETDGEPPTEPPQVSLFGGRPRP